MNELGPVWLTTRREILVRGRSRAFIIGLAVTVLLVVAAVALPRLMGGGGDRYVVGLAGAQSDRLAAVLGAQAEAAEDTELTVVSYPDEAAARAGIESGEVEAAVVDNARLIVAESPGANLRTMLDTAHRIVATEERLRSAGLDPGAVQQAMQVEPLAQVSLSGTSEEEAGTRRMLAMAVVILLFLLIIQACTMVAMGVVEEKGSRIVEILLATIRPAQLLAGKVIGLGVLGLLQIAAIAVAAYAAAQVGGLLPELPEDTPGVLALSVGWFLLGYAFYAVLFAAIASLVSRQEELQSVLTPATLLLMASYFVAIYAVMEPAGTVARVLSIVPPFSAMVMPVRASGGEVPMWETGLAFGLMLLAVLLVLWLGGRVYERAVLRTGARVRIAEVLRAG
ncbi:MAG: ABC transporter permease [Actinomycetes bacterium]